MQYFQAFTRIDRIVFSDVLSWTKQYSPPLEKRLDSAEE